MSRSAHRGADRAEHSQKERKFTMKEYEVTAKEESIDCHGLSFLCIYGAHINGGYVSIMNWGVAAELSLTEKGYNTEQILAALNRSPEQGWLPSDEEARRAVARDLGMMISGRIHDMKGDTNK